jgi:selenocysteine lyase/cysteine desulfurase
VIVAKVDGVEPQRLFERLYRGYGVAGAATGGLRLCAHVYNTQADVDRVIAAVTQAVRETRG